MCTRTTATPTAATLATHDSRSRDSSKCNPHVQRSQLLSSQPPRSRYWRFCVLMTMRTELPPVSLGKHATEPSFLSVLFTRQRSSTFLSRPLPLPCYHLQLGLHISHVSQSSSNINVFTDTVSLTSVTQTPRSTFKTAPTTAKADSSTPVIPPLPKLTSTLAST